MTKPSCRTLSAGRGRTAQDTRDTCWPCRTDAACCVPVGTRGKPEKEKLSGPRVETHSAAGEKIG